MKHIELDEECEEYLFAREKALEDFNKIFITSILERCDWDIKEAAKRANITQTEFINKINRYGIKLSRNKK